MNGSGAAGPAALATILLAGALGLARAADDAREPAAKEAGGAPPLGAATVLAVDLLWLRADALFAEGRWPEMLAAYEAAGRAAPRLSASWEFRGWHLAFNLAGSAAGEPDRDRWVLEGIRMLEDGLRRNPGSQDLRSYLGWTLFERSRRWPSVARRLQEVRGRDPLDEAVGLVVAAAGAEPSYGDFADRAATALAARAERSRAAGDAGSAAADLRKAAGILRAFAATAPPDAARIAGEYARELDRQAGGK